MDNLMIAAIVWSILGTGPALYAYESRKDDWVSNLMLVLAGPLTWAVMVVILWATWFVKAVSWIRGEKSSVHIDLGWN